jgi:hypothetical protein
MLAEHNRENIGFLQLHRGTVRRHAQPKTEVRQNQAGFVPTLSHCTPMTFWRNGAAAQAVDMMDKARASPTCHNPNSSSRQTCLQRDIRCERSGFQLRKRSHGPPDRVHCKETRNTWGAIAMIAPQQEFSQFEIAMDLKKERVPLHRLSAIAKLRG